MATIKQTEEVYNLLEQKLLPIKGTGLAYQISKNLKNIKGFFTELEEVRKGIVDKYTEKDENGNVVEYIYINNETTKQPELATDEEGNNIKATSEDVFKGGKLDFKNPEFQKEIDALMKTEFDNFYKIDLSKLSENQIMLLDGVDLSPLLGCIID